MNCRWVSVAAVALGLLACEEAAAPSTSGTGGLVLEILPTAPGGATHLDSGYVRVHGPTDTLVKATPGQPVTIARLAPGTYTVELEGFVGLNLAYYGKVTGVIVTAGRTTTPTLGSFPLVRVVFTSQPSNVGLGRAMAPAVRVSLVDGNGNVITTARNSVTLALAANPSGGSFSAPQSVTAVSGVATFGNVVISEAGSGYSLVAKSTPLDSVSSAPFNVTNKALVTASGTANVSVIETATNEAVGSIAVGPQPSEDVAFTADGAFAYVPNQSAFVSVINVASGAIAATVPADAGTRGAAFGVTSNGPRVYVTNFASNNVTVINTSTNAVAGTIPVGPTPDRVAVTPDGSKAFVTLFGANMVSVIATGTNSVTTTIPVGAGPQGIAITPAGTLAYVANSNENSVSVIDVAANAVIGTVGVGNYPVGVAITPDGQFVYVAHQNSGFVAVISTTTNDIEAIVPLVAGIRNLAITPGGRFVYVPDGGQRVFVVSTATNAVVDTVSISPAGGALGIGIVPKP